MARKAKSPPESLPPKSCAFCHGRPHVIGPRGAARCGECDRGRRLAELDRERGLHSEAMRAPVRPQSGFEADWTE